MSFGPFAIDDPAQPWSLSLTAAPATDVESVEGGRLVRTRREVSAALTVSIEPDGALHRVSVRVTNTGAAAGDKDDAIARSLIGTHVIAEAVGGEFVSLLDPPPLAADAVSRCRQHRCFPVLAGPPGAGDLLLISPIILYDHPEIAEQSETALYDSTEIDEILTLRVMTMTDQEKAQARATDPLAAQIIDRCDSMSPEAMPHLHGALRDPREAVGLIPEIPDGVDWWDPLADNAVQPEIDAVLVNGVRVAEAAECSCIRRVAPTHRTSSSRARRPASPRCTRTSTATSTSVSSSKTIRPPTCTTGTAATCTSPPMKLNHSKPSPQKGIRHGHRRMGVHRRRGVVRTGRSRGRADIHSGCPAIPQDPAYVGRRTIRVQCASW